MSWVFSSVSLFYLQINAPRIFQALLTAWSEWTFFQALSKTASKPETLWFIFLQLGNYFIYYIGSRTLGNTLEMNLVLLGIACYLNQKKGMLYVF